MYNQIYFQCQLWKKVFDMRVRYESMCCVWCLCLRCVCEWILLSAKRNDFMHLCDGKLCDLGQNCFRFICLSILVYSDTSPLFGYCNMKSWHGINAIERNRWQIRTNYPFLRDSPNESVLDGAWCCSFSNVFEIWRGVRQLRCCGIAIWMLVFGVPWTPSSQLS